MQHWRFDYIYRLHIKTNFTPILLLPDFFVSVALFLSIYHFKSFAGSHFSLCLTVLPCHYSLSNLLSLSDLLSRVFTGYLSRYKQTKKRRVSLQMLPTEMSNSLTSLHQSTTRHEVFTIL